MVQYLNRKHYKLHLQYDNEGQNTMRGPGIYSATKVICGYSFVHHILVGILLTSHDNIWWPLYTDLHSR